MKRLRTIRRDISKSINQMYYALQDYIIKHQTEKGYIDTQNGGDAMYYYAYEDGHIVEGVIKGIRVNGGSIQIIGTQQIKAKYTDEMFARASELYDNHENGGNFGDDEWEWQNIESCWQDVMCDISIIGRYTLMSIVDGIEQYV